MTLLEMQGRAKEATRNRTRYIYPLVNREFLNLSVPKTKLDLKIAILFSGGLRNFYETQEWANKFFIDPLNADVFFHGWCNKDGVEDNKKTMENYLNLKKFKILDKNEVLIPIPAVLNDKYPGCAQRGLGMVQAEHILGQLYNIKNSFDIMREYEQENNVRYDIVIRARPDVFWYAKIEDQDLDYASKNQCISTPQHYLSVICGSNINDQFALGQNEIMYRYTRIFDMVETYGKTVPNDQATEYFVTYHLNTAMSDIAIRDMDMNFMLDYPSDYKIEKGFSNITIRHLNQNDSGVASKVVEDIKKQIK